MKEKYMKEKYMPVPKSNKRPSPEEELLKFQHSVITKKNCKHCFGRGYIGRISTHVKQAEAGRYIPCKCAIPRKENKNEQYQKAIRYERTD